MRHDLRGMDTVLEGEQVNAEEHFTSPKCEISILLLCFSSFDLFYSLLDNDISIENVYIVLSRERANIENMHSSLAYSYINTFFFFFKDIIIFKSR